MGLTYSKSIRVGGFRFNLSGSGIGVSAGIPGFRVGTGPRGAYISMGKGGFRYRQSLSGSSRPRHNTSSGSSPAPTQYFQAPQSNVISTVEHEQVNVMELNDTSGDDLITTLNEQAAKRKRWPIVGGLWLLGLFALAFSGVNTNGGLGTALFVIAACSIFVMPFVLMFLAWRDHVRRTTVLFYELSPELDSPYSAFVAIIKRVAKSKRFVSIQSSSRYADSKYTAGAGVGLGTEALGFKLGKLPLIACNIKVPILETKATKMAFYPDRLVLMRGKQYAGVAYLDMQFKLSSTRFIENGSPPSDATVVGQTWQYVNRNGGPDKRFKNNPKRHICLYDELAFEATGLDIQLMSSKHGSLKDFVMSINSFVAAQAEAS